MRPRSSEARSRAFAVQTVTEWARRAAEVADAPEPEVTVIDAASGVARPGGPRFGTLVHAVLATVALDAGRDAIAEVAALQARILGAPDDETDAATDLVEAALAHPLLVRAREASGRGRCRRETPITAAEPDGSILEGVLDLAFEEDDGWTVVDFKIQAELSGPLARYRRQVGAYAVRGGPRHRPPGHARCCCACSSTRFEGRRSLRRPSVGTSAGDGDRR